jgi:hypothetical protein
MIRDRRRVRQVRALALCPLAWALAAPAFGQLPTVPTPLAVPTARPVRLAPHTEPGRSVPVPPTLEIEVLDPNVDPLGNPAVLTTKVPGGLAVEIPPVVLVHRYYYTGDRSFQGPLLPGGPSIIVVNHPGTGVRQYLEVQMLPGAPRVIYSRHSIIYDYGPQAITLTFGLHGRPRVTYTEGVPLARHIKESSDQFRRNVYGLVDRSGLTEANRRLQEGVRNVAVTSVDRVHDVARIAATPVVKLIKATPLCSVFTSTPEQLAERERDAAVRRAQADSALLDADIRTIR